MFIRVVLSTHLLLKDSQQKQMDDSLVLFAATVVQSKLSKLCRLLSSIFPQIDLHKENERLIGKKQQTQNLDCGRGLWNMDWHC